MRAGVPAARSITFSQLAKELRLSDSTISTNAQRLREGSPLGSGFRDAVTPLVAAERLHALGAEHLRKLRESQAAARCEEAARAEAERIRIEQTEQAKREEQARAAAIEARRLRERQKAARLALEPHLAKLRRDGVIADKDDELYGDAREIVEAGITTVPYPNRRVAAVALAPDDYVFPCGLTAAQLREGVTLRQRLQKSIVREGEPRPDRIGTRPAYLVPATPYPDEVTFYGEDYDEIDRHREMAASCEYLVKYPLPFIVFPEEAEELEDLVCLERQSPYRFENSFLGEDTEDRLRQLRRRAVVPGRIDRSWNVLKWVIAFVALGTIAFLLYGLGVVLRYVLQAIKGWLSEWGPLVAGVALAVMVSVAAIAAVVLWAWPRRGDKEAIWRSESSRWSA